MIDKLIPLKDKLVIVDRSMTKTISLFNSDGTFVCQIGKRGIAPEEYVEIGGVTVDEEGDRIFVLDPTSKNILIYNLEINKYEDRIKLDFSAADIEYIGDDVVACYCDYAYGEVQFKKETIYDNKSPNLI